MISSWPVMLFLLALFSAPLFIRFRGDLRGDLLFIGEEPFIVGIAEAAAVASTGFTDTSWLSSPGETEWWLSPDWVEVAVGPTSTVSLLMVLSLLLALSLTPGLLTSTESTGLSTAPQSSVSSPNRFPIDSWLLSLVTGCTLKNWFDKCRKNTWHD